MKQLGTLYHLDNNFQSSPKNFGELSLIQLGRRYCDKGAVVPDHAHSEWFELSIVTGGEGMIKTNDSLVSVGIGDIYLSFPCELHGLYASEHSRFEYDFFAFLPRGEYYTDFMALTERFYSPTSRTVRDERISYLTSLAINEMNEKHDRSEKLISLLLEEIMIYTLRDFSGIRESAPTVSDAKMLCQRLMSYIDTHVYSIDSLESVAAEFGYSYGYLSSLFRRTTGSTLLEYYRTRRLEIARVLLEEGGHTVNEIAELLGYSTPFTLSTAFKERYGASPKNYLAEREGSDRK